MAVAVGPVPVAYRKFWVKVFITACGQGLGPVTAAVKADNSLKELKSRDEDAEYIW